MQQFDGKKLDESVAFIAVVEGGSFIRAGEALARDASIISKRVAALERRLGVRLLERTTRRIHVTEAGKRFYEQLRSATTAIAEAEQEASNAGTVAHGLLRLSLPGTFGRMWVAPRLPAFLRAHPGVRIEAQYSERNLDLIETGFDAAVRIGSLPDSTLIARQLAHNRRILCAAPAYLKERGTPQSPEDLSQHACLGFSRMATHPAWRLRRRAESKTVRITGPLVADDSSTLVAAACAGLGVLVGVDWLVGRELETGELVRVLPQWSMDEDSKIYLLRPSARFTAGKTKVFFSWMVKQFSPLPWRETRIG
ncbi:MAG TPA: LysR substrate-binding domain-containing protein [Steroidobacteraceae bacterium]|nr:LysR substrate-binding domain-containing protein [Steroidobacteraceae bacterium]